MSINKYNCEGYSDPTPFAALTNIAKTDALSFAAERKYRPRIYLCSPFAGDTERNAEKARRYCAFAVEKGYIPFAAHLFFPQFLADDDPEERALGLFMGLVFLDVCKEVWVFGDYISSGMRAEIARAKKRGIAIRYFTENMEEVQEWDSLRN